MARCPVTAKIAELVGAQPVTVQQAELAQAMATGVIDSYMSASTGYDTKTYEYIKSSTTQAWLPKNAVIVNKKAFDALDPATQDAEEGRRAGRERGWKLSQEKQVVSGRTGQERHGNRQAHGRAEGRPVRDRQAHAG